jgi:hypothetical protein
MDLLKMPSIIIKYQKCGKNNCRCIISRTLHGPYFWLVRYIKPRNKYFKGKYKWKYIGKSLKEFENFIQNEGKKFNIKFSSIEKKIQQYQRELEILKNTSKKSQFKQINLELNKNIE